MTGGASEKRPIDIQAYPNAPAPHQAPVQRQTAQPGDVRLGELLLPRAGQPRPMTGSIDTQRCACAGGSVENTR